MSRGVTTGEGGRDVLLGQGRAKEIGKESMVEGKVGNQHPYLRAVDAQNGTLDTSSTLVGTAISVVCSRKQV